VIMHHPLPTPPGPPPSPATPPLTIDIALQAAGGGGVGAPDVVAGGGVVKREQGGVGVERALDGERGGVCTHTLEGHPGKGRGWGDKAASSARERRHMQVTQGKARAVGSENARIIAHERGVLLLLCAGKCTCDKQCWAVGTCKPLHCQQSVCAVSSAAA